MTEAYRHAEMPVDTSPLVGFLNLRPDQRIILLDFIPLDPGKVNYMLTVRKLEEPQGSNHLETPEDLVVTDVDIEEANIWARTAMTTVVGRNAGEVRFGDSVIPKDKVRVIDNQVSEIEAHVTTVLIGLLSAEPVTVESINKADPDYKVERHGVVSTPDLVRLRVSETEQALTITDAKFYDIKVEARTMALKDKREVADTDILDRNLLSITQALKDHFEETQSQIDD